jgi:putative transposase
MRRPRLKAPKSHSVAYYHCVSRVVNRAFVFGAAEKEKFVEFMRTYERLYGLRVLAYCIMSNHFHVLVEVPQRPSADQLPSDAGLVALVRATLGDKIANALEWELEHFRKMGTESGNETAEAIRERWFSRMWNISTFMKVLKQRFTQWFNGTHQRRGTLWEDRFRSSLVEGKSAALRAMAAYIELNPVRAKICDDPKDYRWCSYAEAVAGGEIAQAALCELNAIEPHGGISEKTTKLPVKEALRRWRCFLFGIPERAGDQAAERDRGSHADSYRSRIPREKALEVLRSGGRLSQADYLRCRVRYFTDGAIIGSREFVEGVFQEARDQFSASRKTAARLMRGQATDGSHPALHSLRNLRKEVFG